MLHASRGLTGAAVTIGLKWLALFVVVGIDYGRLPMSSVAKPNAIDLVVVNHGIIPAITSVYRQVMIRIL